MLSGVAEVGQMVSDRMEAVLIGRPVHSVGDSLPGVRVGAGHHVVAGVGGVARVRDAVSLGFDAVRRLVPVMKWMSVTG